jgi:hypothetical protein
VTVSSGESNPEPEAHTKPPEDEGHSALRAMIGKLGGSQFDEWNNVLVDQVLGSIW